MQRSVHKCSGYQLLHNNPKAQYPRGLNQAPKIEGFEDMVETIGISYPNIIVILRFSGTSFSSSQLFWIQTRWQITEIYFAFLGMVGIGSRESTVA